MARNLGFLREHLSISESLTTIHFSKKRFMAWKEKTNKQERFYKRLVSLASDLPTPDKGKSGDPWKKKKKMEILQKVVRFWVFPIKIKRTLFFSLGKLTVTGFGFICMVPFVTKCRFFFDNSLRPGGEGISRMKLTASGRFFRISQVLKQNISRQVPWGLK